MQLPTDQMKKIEVKKNLAHKVIVGLIVIILAEVCFLGFRLLSYNKNFINTIALATTVKPETFTELYFDNHLKLPSEITQDQTYSFSFTVHNLENKKMAYNYDVYLQAESVKLPIDQNTIILKNNEYKTIHEMFSVNAPIMKSAIVVNLINKNQQIDFWVKSATPPATKTIKKIVTTQIKKPVITPTPLPLLVHTLPLASSPLSSPAATTKQYGGWYVNPDVNKPMVWLGENSNGQDIWTNAVPK